MSATVGITGQGRLGFVQRLVQRSLLALFLLSTASLAQERRTFVVPFHTVNGLILLDATVNDKPAILLLDTGSNHTLVSAPLAGVSVPLKPATVGIGVERQLVRTTVKFGPGEYFAVEAVNLSAVSKNLPERIDGILGGDTLQKFSAVRIDFKHSAIEFEQ